MIPFYSLDYDPVLESREMMMMMMMMMMMIVFVVWLTEESDFALFPSGTIVRGPHHHESPIRSEQDLNLRRT